VDHIKKIIKKIIYSRNINILIKIFIKRYQYHQNIFTRFDNRQIFDELNHDGRDLSPKAFPFKNIYILSDCCVSKKYFPKTAIFIKSLDRISDEEVTKSIFYVYFMCDSDALPYIKRITDLGGIYIPHLDSSKTHYRFINRLAYESLKKTWRKSNRLSYLSDITHENICEALEITKDIEGDYVEIGVYLGASAYTALNYIDELERINTNLPKKTAWLLDTFDGFNYVQASQSSDVIWNNTHHLFGVEKTIEYVKKTLSDVDTIFHLKACNICDIETFPIEIKKIAVANIDVDMYEPTLQALNVVSELMAPGGIIIAEDPASTPALYGALLAMEVFLKSERGSNFLKVFKHGQYFLINNLKK
jgi:hypothetical protein